MCCLFKMLRPLRTSASSAVGLFLMHFTTAEDAEVRRGDSPSGNTLLSHYPIFGSGVFMCCLLKCSDLCVPRRPPRLDCS